MRRQKKANATYERTKSDRLEMFKKVWPNLSEEWFQYDDYTMSLEYFSSEMSMLERNQSIFAIKSISEALDLIACLKSALDITRDDVVNFIRGKAFPSSTSEELILRSLDLAVRLWLPLDVRSSGLYSSLIITGFNSHYLYHVEWKAGVSLRELVKNAFEERNSDQLSNRTKIESTFTMAYLVNACGLKVCWTHNLVDHLSIDWRNSIVTVYEHKIFLWNHLQHTEECIFPNGLLEEAIDTLNLLFPFDDQQTRQFLARQGKPFNRLGYCGRPRTLELEKYHYWQGSVDTLVSIFNQPPRGLQQLKLDKNRRNMMSFATFWVAAIVGVLTTVSIVFGTVSTVYAVKQYNLSVAQACSVPGAATILPQYCI